MKDYMKLIFFINYSCKSARVNDIHMYVYRYMYSTLTSITPTIKSELP